MQTGEKISGAVVGMADVDLHHLARRRDRLAVRELTRRFNQRLFRAAWSILKNRGDAEEVVQDTYLKALTTASDFGGSASYATWLTRISVNLALQRRRADSRRAGLLAAQGVVAMADHVREADAPISHEEPDRAVARAQFARQLETAVAMLPDEFRVVFVLREIEGMGVGEAAEALGIPEATVKTRLLRGRRRLREILEPELRSALQGAFPFGGEVCAALTERLLIQLAEFEPGEET